MKNIKVIFLLSIFILSKNLFAMIVSESLQDNASKRIDLQLDDIRSHWQHLQELSAPSLLESGSLSSSSNTKAKTEQSFFVEAFSNLSANEKSKLACVLCQKLEEEKHSSIFPKKGIIDDTTYRDLELFSGKPGDLQRNFVSRTNRTYTAMGKVTYCNMLYSPTTDLDILIARQKGVRKLAANNLYDKLTQKLKVLAQVEAKMLALWAPQTEAACMQLKQFYVEDPIPAFGSDHLHKQLQNTNATLSKKANESAAYLDAKRLFELMTKPVFDLTMGLFNMSGELYSTLERHPAALILDPRGLERAALNAALFASTYYLPDEYRLNAFRVTTGGSMLYWLGRSYKDLYQKEKCVLELHKTMREIALSVRTMQEIVDLIQKNKALVAAVDSQQFFQQSQDPVLQACITSLNSDYFKQEPSLFGCRGKALATFAQLRDVKDKLIPLYAYVGAIDALVGVATLMKESAGTSTPYAYARYEKNVDKPRLTLHDCWNPFIDGKTAVVNSIDLNGVNALLTGPNMGGKSTTLKMAVLCALLSQTLGITPGNVKSSSFDLIMTLLNMHDKAGLESGLQAHEMRIKMLLEKLKKLPLNQFAFVAPDELLNTTEQESASRICKQLFMHIAKNYSNTLFMAATHFPALSSLEQESCGRIVNYKMGEAVIDGEEINWPYKLEKGVNTQNVASFITEKFLKELSSDNEFTSEKHA